MLTRIPARLRGVLFDTGTTALLFGAVAIVGGLSMPEPVLLQLRNGMHFGTDVTPIMVRLMIVGTLATSVASTTILVACVSATLRLLVAPLASFAWAKAMKAKAARHGAVRIQETADVA